MADVVFRRVEVDGRLVDVHVRRGTIAAAAPELDVPGDVEVIDGDGGALLPGLHDHHVHLLATAAARLSVHVGPPDVTSPAGLAHALGRVDHTAGRGRWIRAVGYHHSVAGDLDRDQLDALVPDRPLRVQDRTGARWTLNSAGMAALGLTGDEPQMERDGAGRLTGRLHRADEWLRARITDGHEPDGVDLGELGAELTRVGVTGVTDTTPVTSIDAFDVIAAAVRAGDLTQRVVVTGAVDIADQDPPVPLEAGPVKIVIDDAEPDRIDDVAAVMSVAHDLGRLVHCVTAEGLAVAIAAWQVASPVAGDRVEHGSVIVPEAIEVLRHLGVTVVTQPGFIAERGDQYLSEVDPADLASLYRVRSLIDAGIPVGLSTDSPYTAIDPWRAVAAASRRQAPSGSVIGPEERIAPLAALERFLTHPTRPGGAVRRIRPGTPADLCLLDAPLAAALERPGAEHVRWSGRLGVEERSALR